MRIISVLLVFNFRKLLENQFFFNSLKHSPRAEEGNFEEGLEDR